MAPDAPEKVLRPGWCGPRESENQTSRTFLATQATSTATNTKRKNFFIARKYTSATSSRKHGPRNSGGGRESRTSPAATARRRPLPDGEPPGGKHVAPKQRRWTGIEPAGRGSPVPPALKAGEPTRRSDTSGGDPTGPRPPPRRRAGSDGQQVPGAGVRGGVRQLQHRRSLDLYDPWNSIVCTSTMAYRPISGSFEPSSNSTIVMSKENSGDRSVGLSEISPPRRARK